MPSVSKPQATLMAMAAKSPALAKRRGIPQRVAREFNRADKRTGILKRGAGGRTPKESGMNSMMNEGRGHGQNFFSTTPLMGQAMSGTQLGQADRTIRNAHATLARFAFADGGSVKTPKPQGPSAKERREIRTLIERGKNDAVETLRGTRAALLQKHMPEVDADYTAELDRLHERLAMADGGEVETPAELDAGEPVSADPRLMYDEYMQLLDVLQDPNIAPDLQAEVIERLSQIETRLEALGIEVEQGAAPE